MIEMRYSARELSSEAKSKGIVSFANEEQQQYDYDDDDDYYNDLAPWHGLC